MIRKVIANCTLRWQTAGDSIVFFCVKYILKVGRNCRMSIISVHEILLTDGQTDGQRSFSNSARFVDTEP